MLYYIYIILYYTPPQTMPAWVLRVVVAVKMLLGLLCFRSG